MKNGIEVGKGQFKRKLLAQSLALALGTTLLGNALPALAAAPLGTPFNPRDDSDGTIVTTALTLRFDQTVSAAAGKNLVIRKSADNSVVATIAANDTAKVTLSGSKATINPPADLEYSTGYYVQIDAGAFVNAAGEAYAGIADTTSWNFTTTSAASATLTATAYAPVNGATDIVRTADLSMSFSSTVCGVTPVAGKNIVIKKFSGNSVEETIAANDTAKVTLSCSKQSIVSSTTNVIINPANDLLFNTRYFVQIDAGAFQDASGLRYAGILDDTTWTFTTIPDTVAPTVPTGLSATTVGATQATLLWTASTDNAGVTAYKVYRNGFLVSTQGNVLNFSDTGLTASTVYSYTVAACDAAGNCSSLATPVSATTAAAPTPIDTQAPTVPTGLTAAANDTSAVFLSWGASTDNVGVTAYKVYRGGTPLAALGNETSYTDTGLAAATAYSYSVAACDKAGNCSAQSPLVSATTNSPPKPIASTTEVVKDPNPNVSVSKGGSLVIDAPSDQPPPKVVLKTDALLNVDVKLPPNKPVIFSSNGIEQKITDVDGQSQFLTVNKGGVTQIELRKGQMQVDADKIGTNILVTSSNSQSNGSLVTSKDNTSIGVVKDEKKSTVFVDGGKVLYTGGKNLGVSVFQGENSNIDPGGNLTELKLGSKNGEKQVPGDPLSLTIPKDTNTKVVNLEGTLARFDNSLSLSQLVVEFVQGVLGNTAAAVSGSFDKATGVLTLTIGGGEFARIVRLTVLGDVLVRFNEFAAGNISATAGGAFSLASRGIQMSLSGALGYFGDLQSEVKKLDSNAQLSLKSTGAIEMRLAGGRYVVLPGMFANVPANPTPLPGFESDGSGYAVFRDRTGALQSLYPTFLEADSLNSAFASLVPNLSLSNNGNGTVTMGWDGPPLTLRPDYTIIDLPAGHDSDRYWVDFGTGTIYFRNSDQSAQGFRLE